MQNLLDELFKALKDDKRLLIDGRLAKNKIVELALAMDEGLITLLLKNKAIKKHFFTKLGETLVFDKVAFQSFVSNKQFLPDSYTAFKNKIGLTVNKEYLTESKEVVLSWPYKDCVLEGGQTKEDQKRDEIFWNETLAPDEINRLLASKVLTNFKRYDKDGEHKVDNIRPDDNLIIKGNNLLVLHSLRMQYSGKIDLIYIDPPFNTENDSFLYNDSFNRSSWLSFMKTRLIAAEELLSKAGTIYVHIDHNEGHYLKVLMDEVFGINFFRNEIIWRYSGWNKKLTNSFERRHDTIFMYGKSDDQYFNSYFEKWASKEEYVKKRKQKLLTDEDGKEYVLSDAGGGKRTPMYIEDVLEKGVVVDDVWDLDKLNNSAKESVNFTSQKREALLERIITASCPENGIVLDFNLGSGTTAAVAHKMERRYFGVEQMEYVNTITVERLKSVIKGEKEGISKDVNWKGGGSFIYCELSEHNAQIINKIEKAKTTKTLKLIWHEIEESDFISHKVKPESINKDIKEFEALSLDEQKQLLIAVLDKNQLYVNYSEIDDKDYKISKEDKKLNKQFYGEA
jgi:adenine-specific DNA-methyltransferase